MLMSVQTLNMIVRDEIFTTFDREGCLEGTLLLTPCQYLEMLDLLDPFLENPTCHVNAKYILLILQSNID